MQLVSELHVYSGNKFSDHIKLQIGNLCPDEILDLELDNQIQNYAGDDGETNSNIRSQVELHGEDKAETSLVYNAGGKS